MLPCPAEAFTDFISALLGRPQTITKNIRGTFDIERADISDFYHLVEQRLVQQNDSHLVQFTVRMVYDDGSSVLLNSHDDFVHYNEVRPVATVAAHLSWTYLIKFRDKSSPEKQQIDVAILGSRKSGVALLDDDDPLPLVTRSSGRRGVVSFRIHHTARTWGADIEALLTAHVNSLLKTESPLRKWLQKRSGLVGMLTAVLLMLSSLVTAIVSSNRFARAEIAAVQSIVQKAQDTSVSVLAERMDSVVQIAAAGDWPRFLLKLLLFLFVSTIISFALGIWATAAADNVRPSFVNLTKESTKRKEEMVTSFKRQFRAFILSIVVSIFTGVVGNYLFACVWGPSQPAAQQAVAADGAAPRR